jgi:ParB family transcriptional regulator, chromosome partitioning protein
LLARIMRFRVETVSLKSVDPGDRTYKISTDRPLDDLLNSIQHVGLLSLPLLGLKSDRYTIISGFRRVAACLRLGWPYLQARIADANASGLECLKAAIADNATNRRLNPIEQAIALSRLSAYYADDRELNRVAETLGMEVAPPLISKLKQLCRVSKPFQEGVLSGAISMATALELADLDEASATALFGVFASLRPTFSHQKRILALVREISLRDGIQIPGLLKEAVIIEILHHSGVNRNQKIEAMLDALKRRRYPKISGFEKGYQRLVQSLELNGRIRIVPPKDFEGNLFSISINFQTRSEIKAYVRLLARVVERPEFAAMVRKEIADY